MDILEPGEHLRDGRYRIERELGRGSMGIVYEATDFRFPVKAGFEKRVAVKIVRPDAPEQFRKLFVREAKNMARLGHHPNVVCMLDWDWLEKDGEDVPYIVLELSEGSLDKADLAGDIRKVLQLGLDACRGLAYAHSHGIIHRDIKPSNLLWVYRQTGVKLADFGLAKPIDAHKASYSLNAPGSLPYAAPEQLGAGELDKRTDTYQLGVTLYWLLTRRRPFEGDLPTLVKAIEGERPKPPMELRSEISSALSDVILQMLAKNPNDRPKSLDEVSHALEDELFSARICYDRVSAAVLHKCPVASKIREALADKVKRVVTFLAEAGSAAVPLPGQEGPNWYATVLLRPFEAGSASTKGLASKFHPIYFAGFRHTQRYAWSDWLQSPELLQKPLDIGRCCSGLPIRWYVEVQGWRRNKANQGLFDCTIDTGQRIRYFALRNVKKARFDRDMPDNLIRQTYATDRERLGHWDRAVGWELRTSDGERVEMSQDIESEILIPIYSPSVKGSFGPHDIIGVANFEWDELLSADREKQICKELSGRIQDDRRFPISLFTCDVLQHVTTPDKEE